jgi:L-aspartate oxidase
MFTAVRRIPQLPTATAAVAAGGGFTTRGAIRTVRHPFRCLAFFSTTTTSSSDVTTALDSFFNSTAQCSSNSNNLRHPSKNGNHHHQNQHDRLLVVGSGVAGCAAALVAAELYRIPVTVLFAGSNPTDCNSNWAQGGIIYRNYDPASGDGPALLAADIHRAGAGLCADAAVRKVAEEGPERVRQLLLSAAAASATSTKGSGKKGSSSRFANVPFDRDAATGELSLCLEASHAAPRILHKADHTGRVITEHLTRAAANHPLITLQGGTVVTDLLSSSNSNHAAAGGGGGLCVGVQTLTGREYAAYGTVLASGGLAGIYEHSTNPAGFNALGSSVALATRAGVATQDLEYVQFHPTALCLPGQAPFLLTEALRGEGAVLRDATGRAFAREYHPDGELAPRDVVARAVFAELQKQQQKKRSAGGREGGGGGVYLDITHRDADWLYQRFPSICAHLRRHGGGRDLALDPLPIIPAAHYTCGGISTDLNGCTSLPNCYAAGEAARTGLHGGNRLASTSLLEGLVFGASVADHVGAKDPHLVGEAGRAITALQNRPQPPVGGIDSPDRETAMQLLQRLRRVMWDHVGVTRTTSGLRKAVEELRHLMESAEVLHAVGSSYETAALRDATCAGHAVAKAALANPKSVGAHCLLADDAESDDEEASVEAAMR